MGGGPIIIIDGARIKSGLSVEDTVTALRQAADALEAGNADLEAVEETE